MFHGIMKGQAAEEDAEGEKGQQARSSQREKKVIQRWIKRQRKIKLGEKSRQANRGKMMKQL